MIADPLAAPDFAIPQFTDVEPEINGLLTYGRKPKFDAKLLQEINATLR